MTDVNDVLLRLYEEQRRQARHSEDQRATISNIVLIVASAILGFVSQNGLVPTTLPLTVLLIAIGLYGAVASEKLYERFRFHANRSSYLRKQIDKLNPKASCLKIFNEADDTHRKEYPVLLKIRVHMIWLWLHIAIAVAGIVLTTLAVVLNLS
jgi:hypothetical protein